MYTGTVLKMFIFFDFCRGWQKCMSNELTLQARARSSLVSIFDPRFRSISRVGVG